MFEFDVCSCGRHGRFNTRIPRSGRDGGRETIASGHEVATKDDAKAFIQTAFDRNVIPLGVATSLFVKIDASAMAETEEVADPAVLTAARDWNLQFAVVTNPTAFLTNRPKACLVAASAS